MLRQVVCDVIPSRAVTYEGMKLRTDSGIIIKRAHSNRHFRTIWPISTEDARAAGSAKRFYRAFTFAVNLNQFGSLE